MANGVYTTIEIIESIILDLNNLPKELIAGQFIQSCTLVSQMGQKLIGLRDGVKAEIEGKDKTIEGLKQQLRNTGAEVTDMTVAEFAQKYGKKDGAE